MTDNSYNALKQEVSPSTNSLIFLYIYFFISLYYSYIICFSFKPKLIYNDQHTVYSMCYVLSSLNKDEACLGIIWPELQRKSEKASKLPSHIAFKSRILSMPHII